MSERESKIRIGVSSCLLGQEVRFDGGHKHDKFITKTLGLYFEWLPVCPEVELGLGTPRPTLRFEIVDSKPRLMQSTIEEDVTDRMQKFSSKRVRHLQKQSIYGYILKAKSPSCGMEKVKLYRGHGVRPLLSGVGLFAKCLIESMPNLPVEEEGRLCDPVLRENWVNRVFAFHRFHTEVLPRPTVGKLVKFHTRYKFIVLSHCNTSYRKLGQLVADSKNKPINDVICEYETLFMSALKKKATAEKHVNVMEHMIGFFKKELNSEIKRELLDSVSDYKKGFVPIVVPITLIKHYAKILGVDYLVDQAYLNPHPKELALRSQL